MSVMKPKNGMFRFFRGIRAVMDITDEKKYREVLPIVFDMPKLAQISIL